MDKNNNKKITVQVFYNGFSQEADKRIEVALGKKATASGYGFGIRDMEFQMTPAEVSRAWSHIEKIDLNGFRYVLKRE